jgi:hypothetical protein
MKSKKEAALDAWVAWTKARHGWSKRFALDQATLFMAGRRGADLHDVTCVVFEKYFLPIYEDC